MKSMVKSTASTTRRFFVAGLGCVMVAMVASPSTATAQQCEPTLERIRKAGVLKAGVRLDYPPVGAADERGRPIGFGPDMAKAVAEKLKVKVEYVVVVSSTRIPMLQNCNVDALFESATPTRRREEVVDFTIPYVWDTGTLLILQGGGKSLKDYRPPKSIATIQGGLWPELIRKEIENPKLVLLQNFNDAVAALLAGRVDAVAINRFAAARFVSANSKLTMGDTFFADPWAIGVRQNDSSWRNYLNWTLQELWVEGVYQQLYEQWFGERPNFRLWSEFGLQPGIPN